MKYLYVTRIDIRETRLITSIAPFSAATRASSHARTLRDYDGSRKWTIALPARNAPFQNPINSYSRKSIIPSASAFKCRARARRSARVAKSSRRKWELGERGSKHRTKRWRQKQGEERRRGQGGGMAGKGRIAVNGQFQDADWFKRANEVYSARSCRWRAMKEPRCN